MLSSMYMARMGFVRIRTGPGAHLAPYCVEEVPEGDAVVGNLRSTDASDSKYDAVFADNISVAIDGFGVRFSRDSLDNKIHHARVAVIDFADWKLRHYLHFLGKLVNLIYKTVI